MDELVEVGYFEFAGLDPDQKEAAIGKLAHELYNNRIREEKLEDRKRAVRIFKRHLHQEKTKKKPEKSKLKKREIRALAERIYEIRITKGAYQGLTEKAGADRDWHRAVRILNRPLRQQMATDRIKPKEYEIEALAERIGKKREASEACKGITKKKELQDWLNAAACLEDHNKGYFAVFPLKMARGRTPVRTAHAAWVPVL